MIDFAGVLFTDGKKLLLIRRADGDHKGKWDIPGGHIEENESPLKAARREGDEEVGTARGQKIHEFKNPFVYIFKISSPFKVELSNEHSASKWVTLDEVTSFDLHPAFKNNWKKYLNKIRELTSNSSFREWLKLEDYGYCRIKFYE